MISLEKTQEKPKVLIVDDDEDFTKMMKLLLNKYGVESIVTHNAKEFLSQLKTIKPALCFIDLNLDRLGEGFTLIKAVRNVLGAQLPLVVLSVQADHNAVAHAIELGANDYLTKPLDRALLVNKLARFIATSEILGANSYYIPVPEGGSPAQVELDLDIIEVDEFGMKIRSPHLLMKGVVYAFESPLLFQIFQTTQPVLCTVNQSSLDPARPGYFLAHAEFDLARRDLMTSLRQWLSNAQVNQKKDELRGDSVRAS